MDSLPDFRRLRCEIEPHNARLYTGIPDECVAGSHQVPAQRRHDEHAESFADDYGLLLRKYYSHTFPPEDSDRKSYTHHRFNPFC